MLSLDIQKGGDVYIGDNIRVLFKRSVGKDCIRLCIDAPEDVKILRGELLRKSGTDAGKQSEIESAWSSREAAN